MSKKSNVLSEGNLGQVAGGSICINDDGSVTLKGIDAERYLDRKARRRIKNKEAKEAKEAPANAAVGCYECRAID